MYLFKKSLIFKARLIKKKILKIKIKAMQLFAHFPIRELTENRKKSSPDDVGLRQMVMFPESSQQSVAFGSGRGGIRKNII